MPYHVARSDACPASRPWAVLKVDSTKPVGCHPSQASAERQMAALYANEPEVRTMPEHLAVKFIDGSTDTIEGPLAPFGGPIDGKDLHGEYFSAKTDFALDWFGDWQRPLLYQHGLDDTLKTEVVGRIKVEQRAKGLWMQAQLDAAHEYHDEIAALVAEGALGASSGSVAHLVQRDRKTGEIRRWPLIEGSLTPTPANPDAQVGYAVKSADAVAHLAVVGSEAPPEAILITATGREIPIIELDGSAAADAAILTAVKEGRRNSSADLAHIQSAHDVMVALGATCTPIAAASKDVTAEPAPAPAAMPVLGIKAAEPSPNVVSDSEVDALRELFVSHAIKVARDILRV